MLMVPIAELRWVIICKLGIKVPSILRYEGYGYEGSSGGKTGKLRIKKEVGHKGLIKPVGE